MTHSQAGNNYCIKKSELKLKEEEILIWNKIFSDQGSDLRQLSLCQFSSLPRSTTPSPQPYHIYFHPRPPNPNSIISLSIPGHPPNPIISLYIQTNPPRIFQSNPKPKLALCIKIPIHGCRDLKAGIWGFWYHLWLSSSSIRPFCRLHSLTVRGSRLANLTECHKELRSLFPFTLTQNILAANLENTNKNLARPQYLFQYLLYFLARLNAQEYCCTVVLL